MIWSGECCNEYYNAGFWKYRNPKRFRWENVIMEADTVWRCVCGNIEHGEFPPEDCPKCLRVNKFKPVPEDLVEEMEAEEILSSREDAEEEEDAD